jgi:hypothetical protein
LFSFLGLFFFFNLLQLPVWNIKGELALFDKDPFLLVAAVGTEEGME